MSFQAMAWAVKEPLPPYEKLAILVLANYANADGICWPSIRRICIDSGMSKAQACKIMLKLEKKNLLVRMKRLHENKGSRSTVYKLAMGKDDPSFEGQLIDIPDSDEDAED